MSTKPNKKNQESNSLQEQIIKLEKQLESFKHSNDHFLKNKLFLHYDIKEPEKVVVDCETKLPVLAEVDKKKIQKGKESDPTHLIIEGDNYHALSVLNYTHASKIDLIYIDPPYNTGNKDFIYNDRFVDREDAFRHSKWLSFMAHRLRLAKNLLAETGVIFISIDDNEQAHLRLLCDQIFGEENFVAHITIQGSANESNEGVMFQNVTEYLFCYARNKPEAQINKIDPVNEDWRSLNDAPSGLATRRQMGYTIYYNPETQDIIPEMDYDPNGDFSDLDNIYKDNKKLLKNGYVAVRPKERNGVAWRWRWGMDNLIERKNELRFRENRNGTWVVEFGQSGFNAPRDYQEFGTGTVELKRIFDGKEVFTRPKSTEFIQWILEVGSNKSATILDFFAGSGTTGHAVLKLNAQDGGTRQFILCSTNDEKEPIVDKVTYPRIKKVIDGYGDNAPIPTNLRYLQTDFVEKKGSASQLKIDLTRQCAEMLCVKENVFESVKLKKHAKNYKFFKNSDKYLGVFFDFFTDAEFAGFIKELNALPKEAEKAVYVFVLDGSAGILADEFASVANCEVKEIPQKILDIYKQLAREVAKK